MTTQTPISEEELRTIYHRCDVSNNRTDDPLSEDEFVALIKQYGNQCRVDGMKIITKQAIGKPIKDSDGRFGAMQRLVMNDYINNQSERARQLIHTSELTQTNEEES